MRSEWANTPPGSEKRKLLHDALAVDFEHGGFIESGFHRDAEWVLVIHDEVTNVRGHDKVGNANAATSRPFSTVMVFHRYIYDCTLVLALVSFWAVDPCGSFGQEISPSVEDKISVAGLFPVIDVVVAILD